MLFVKQFISIFITLSLIVQTSLANSSTFTTSNVNINNAYNIAKNLDSSYLNKNGTTNIIANTINIASNIHANNLSLKADATMIET
ncbi:hypothetical protein [Campylobacter majalis]|uniref:hypothetical protein n=1 Tax=Campylobacter majalis TaxID=2790656 RepID=UPI003D68C7CA